MTNLSFCFLRSFLIMCSVLFLLVSCDKEAVLTPEQILVGAWAGSVSQEGYADFQLQVNISDVSDQIAGAGNYDQECTFSWTLREKKGEAFVFYEEILSGDQFCIDGVVSVSILSENTIEYYWEEEGFEDNFARGTLSRM